MARRSIDDWADNGPEYVGRQTPGGFGLRVLGWGVAIVVVLAVVGGLVGLGLGWFNTAVGVVSPQNVKAQWQFAYDYNEHLKQAATNWCSAKKLESTATGQDAINERQSQTAARENVYNSIMAEYNGRLEDAFRAKLVKPDDVPDRAPTLPQEVTALGLTGCAA